MQHLKFYNQKGYSLTELLVVMAIVGLTGIGTMAMMGNLMTKNRVVNTKATLLAIRDRFENTIRDREAWRETIYSTSNDGVLDCLRITARENERCRADGTDNVAAGALTLRSRGLLDVTSCTDGEEERNEAACRDGGIFFDDTVAGNGFTDEGEPCNTWAAGGNDACPIGIDLTVQMRCRNNRTRCKNPRIVVGLIFNFSPSTDGSILNTIDSSKYSANFDLSERNEREFFEVKFINAAGGGVCPDNVATPRPINQLTYEVGNPIVRAGAANPLRAGADQDVHVRPGIYHCRVTAHISGVDGGARFWLEDRTNGVNYPVGFAQTHIAGTTATAKGTAIVDSNQNFRLRLMTLCRNPAGVASDMGLTEPGFIASGNYSEAETSQTHTTIRCNRIN